VGFLANKILQSSSELTSLSDVEYNEFVPSEYAGWCGEYFSALERRPLENLEGLFVVSLNL
jgi:hypothetical protein